jgi:hypothetical protein
LEVLAALQSGPKSISGIHQRLCGDRKSLYTLVAEMLRKGLIARLPGRRHDPHGDPQQTLMTFYCLPIDKPVQPVAEDEREEELHPVRKLAPPTNTNRTMERIRAAKARGIPAGPTYARGFANWGSRR